VSKPNTNVLSNIFIPICKIDVEQRLVYGKATFEAPDSSGEIWDYETSKPHFEEWSEAANKNSGGKSLGNLRSMHGPIAAGKLTQFYCDDASKAVEIAAKVVDDAEWNKVLEGVYTGFSQGGKYIKRWKDPTDATKTRFTSAPVEISLVDLPCLPGATFEYVKADGSTELRKFNTSLRETSMYEPTNDEVAARATAMAKSAGGHFLQFIEQATAALKAEHGDNPPAPAPVETPETTEAPADVPADPPVADDSTDAPAPVETDENADKAASAREAALKSVEQVWKAPDGETFKRKDEAIDHILGKSAPANPVQAALAEALKAANGETAPTDASVLVAVAADMAKWEEILKAAQTVSEGDTVAKGMYQVSSLADACAQVGYLCENAGWERQREGDSSSVPEQLAGALKQLGAALVTMAQEEIAELLAGLTDSNIDVSVLLAGSEPHIVALAAGVEMTKANTAVMEKIGARNAKKDQANVQKVHDSAVELGAECGTADKAAGAEDLAKRAENDPVLKGILDENTLLKTQVTEAVDGIGNLTKMFTTLQTEMAALKRTPTEMAPRTQPVGKGEEITPSAVDNQQAAVVAEMMKSAEGQKLLSEAAIRLSQQQGYQLR